MRVQVLGSALLSVLLAAVPGSATPQQDLDSASTKGRTAFVLVTDAKAEGVAAARDLVSQATHQVKGSVLVELDRSDPGNTDLVRRFRLLGAPVPVVLVVVPNGAVAAGMPVKGATVERLVAAVPSPKKAEVLGVLQVGQPVFVVAGHGDVSRTPAASACASARESLNGAAGVVSVSLDDPGEAAFLEQLKLDRNATGPFVVVVNASGQITANLTGGVESATLVAAANKRASGCCPSTVQGGAKSCGPK